MSFRERTIIIRFSNDGRYSSWGFSSTNLVYRSYVVQVADRELLVHLILLDIQDFDII